MTQLKDWKNTEGNCNVVRFNLDGTMDTVIERRSYETCRDYLSLAAQRGATINTSPDNFNHGLDITDANTGRLMSWVINV